MVRDESQHAQMEWGYPSSFVSERRKSVIKPWNSEPVNSLHLNESPRATPLRLVITSLLFEATNEISKLKHRSI